jgi:hypothetical protein
MTTWNIKYIIRKIINKEYLITSQIELLSDNQILDDEFDLTKINNLSFVIYQYINYDIQYINNLNIICNTKLYCHTNDTILNISDELSNLVNIPKNNIKIILMDYHFINNENFIIDDINTDLPIILFNNCLSILIKKK